MLVGGRQRPRLSRSTLRRRAPAAAFALTEAADRAAPLERRASGTLRPAGHSMYSASRSDAARLCGDGGTRHMRDCDLGQAGHAQRCGLEDRRRSCPSSGRETAMACEAPSTATVLCAVGALGHVGAGEPAGMMRSSSPIRNHDAHVLPTSGRSPDGSTSASCVAGRCVAAITAACGAGTSAQKHVVAQVEAVRVDVPGRSLRRGTGPGAPSPRRACCPGPHGRELEAAAHRARGAKPLTSTSPTMSPASASTFVITAPP